MSSNLERLQQLLGYQFKDPDLLLRALSHRSSGKNHNERLEFLGDSLVNMAMAEFLFHEFPSAPEGDLSALRAKLVCRDSLASAARELKLGDYLLLGEGTSKTGGHRLDSILADAYEALIGALYLDADWDAVVKIIRQHFAERIRNIGDVSDARDSKSRLQEWLQAGKYPLPRYELMNVDGPGHSQNFRISCRAEPLPGEYLGEGSSRRKAEQNAAERALNAIENTDDQAQADIGTAEDRMGDRAGKRTDEREQS